MAGLTKAQRAEKAALKADSTVNVVIPESKPVRSRISAEEYAKQYDMDRPQLNGMEQRMAYYGENPGWKRRWVNENNVPQREQERWRYVLREEVSMSNSVRFGNSDVGAYVSQVVGGFHEDGRPMKAFLMEIPLSMAERLDYEKSLKKVAMIDHSIRSGTIGLSDTRNMRIPADTPISITTK